MRYFRGVAQDWELQALLKLRPSAGDAGLGREFVEGVQELIYCKELSLCAIRTAAQSLERIRRGVTRKGGGGLDVKSGPGGLREIEFAVQRLQRVHGGREPWLRSSGTLFALQKLHDKGHIGDAEFRELGAAYTTACHRAPVTVPPRSAGPPAARGRPGAGRALRVFEKKEWGERERPGTWRS